jgi:chorismate dehydratase
VERIALDPASQAAATLTRVLLGDRSGEARTFVDVDRGVDPSTVPADAWLEIGDAALRRALAEDAPPAWNPCREWTRRTGLPFAFAVWIVNPGVQLTATELEAFARARKRGHARIRELAAEASRTWNLPLAECRRYLEEECLYEPGEKLAPALAAFRDAAAALGLCDGALRPVPIALPAAHVA